MIALGCDHGDYELKEAIKNHLKSKGIQYKDVEHTLRKVWIILCML